MRRKEAYFMDEHLFFNGIDATTGGYLLPELTIQELAKVASGEKLDKKHFDDLKERKNRKESHYGVAQGIDQTNLEQTGWGIIFAFADAQAPAIREALSELREHRKKQVGNPKFYREFIGSEAYRPGESKSDFLSRFKVGPGPVNPEKGVPYYLLIVGNPDVIPYSFQYQLDVQFAVGRLFFDTLEEYANYARSVVDAETGNVKLPYEATFFGVRNADDPPTNLSAENLVAPLADEIGSKNPDWRINRFLAEEATRAQLSQVLGGTQTPAFLFVASHGMGFPKDDPRQKPHQGAILCQDWPGPQQWRQPIPEDFYFAGDHIDSSANLLGTMAFFFACYGAGTPEYDDFHRQAFNERSQIAAQPFIAQLPQRLLGHPRGGALAVAGHVERAWGYSFMWGQAGRQVEVFRSAMLRLMEGHPVGSAFEFFDERYAEIASDLTVLQDEIEVGFKADPYKVAGLWTANHDARNYIILGDPAVRIPLADKPDGPTTRPAIDATTISIPDHPPPATPPSQPAETANWMEGEADLSFTPPEPAEQNPLVKQVEHIEQELQTLRTTAHTATRQELQSSIQRIEQQVQMLKNIIQQRSDA